MSFHIRVSTKAVIVEDGSILLVEYLDESGLHYNLPGGGVEEGESLAEGLRREAREETGLEIEPGPLLWVVEYEPGRNRQWAGPTPKLAFIFAAQRRPGSRARLPQHPDDHQTAVRWIALEQLETVELLPHISDRILEYMRSGERGPTLLEEPIRPERVKRYLPDPPPEDRQA